MQMILKRIVLSMLVVVFCVMSVSVPEARAADTPDVWAVESVNRAVSLGIVPQSLQGKYAQPITRAEFCAILVAAYEKLSGKEIEFSWRKPTKFKEFILKQLL